MNSVVYVGNASFNVLPLANANPLWIIRNPIHRFFLRSVLWTFNIYDMTNLGPVPVENNDLIAYQLNIAQLGGAGLVVGLDFLPDTVPDPSLTDRRITIMKPGQYFFNDIYFQNDLTFFCVYGNSDLLNTYNISQNLTVEIAEE